MFELLLCWWFICLFSVWKYIWYLYIYIHSLMATKLLDSTNEILHELIFLFLYHTHYLTGHLKSPACCSFSLCGRHLPKFISNVPLFYMGGRLHLLLCSSPLQWFSSTTNRKTYSQFLYVFGNKCLQVFAQSVKTIVGHSNKSRSVFLVCLSLIDSCSFCQN